VQMSSEVKLSDHGPSVKRQTVAMGEIKAAIELAMGYLLNGDSVPTHYKE